jgi:two-component system, NtrC family, response regulator AtoC
MNRPNIPTFLLDMLPFFKRKRRVLILDDDPSMQRLVSAVLKREGYRVDAFLTGRDALRAMEKTDYHVLLLDLMMPHEGGITVIRELQANHPDLLQRVLVLTGSPQSLMGNLKSEVAGVVQKPFEATDLIDAVRRISEP